MIDATDIETYLDDAIAPAATIRRRKKNEQSWSDANCTPLWLAELLPLVDLDPASNPRSHIRSRWSYSLEKKLDGLRLPWRGSVFLNHPYSNPMPFMSKLNHELSIGRCTSAIVLAKMDCSTKSWGVLTAPVAVVDAGDYREPPAMWNVSTRTAWWIPDLWLFNDRIEFDEHPESIEYRKQQIREAKAQGKKPPPEKTSNNFCSAIVHHRFDGEPLVLDKYATLWRRP